MSPVKIEPPEVPLDTPQQQTAPSLFSQYQSPVEFPKKKGLLKRLFSKDDAQLHEELPFHTEEELSRLDSDLEGIRAQMSTPDQRGNMKFVSDINRQDEVSIQPSPEQDQESYDPFGKAAIQHDGTMRLPPDFAPSFSKPNAPSKRGGKKENRKQASVSPSPTQETPTPAREFPFQDMPPQWTQEPAAQEMSGIDSETDAMRQEDRESIDLQPAPEPEIPQKKSFFSRLLGKGKEQQEQPAQKQMFPDLESQPQPDESQSIPPANFQLETAPEMQESPVQEQAFDIAREQQEGNEPLLTSAQDEHLLLPAPEQATQELPDINMERIRKKITNAFETIDREADKIEKEVSLILKGEHKGAPEALTSSKTLKELLADLKKLDKEKFQRYRIKNKDDFANMVRSMAHKQQHMEETRTEILKHLVTHLLKEQGIKMDFRIAQLKKGIAEKLVRDEQQVRLIEEKQPQYLATIARMNQEKAALEEIKTNIKTVVEDRIKDELPKRLAKERTALAKQQAATEKLKISLATEEQRLLAKQEALEKAKTRKDHEIADFEAAYQENEDRREKQLKEKTTKLDEQHKERQQQLAQARKNFELEKRKALTLLKQASSVHQETLTLEQKKAALKNEETQFEQKKKQWEVAVDAEQKLEESEEVSLHQIERELKRAKKGLDNEHRKIEKLEYNKYIEDQLKGIRPSQRIEAPIIVNPQKSNHPIYKDIEDCRKAIKNKDFSRARMMYNQLKQDFYATKVSQDEKAALYTTLRELYTDINLGMLNS